MDVTDKVSVIFLGQGSPIIAIQENRFVAGLQNVGEEIESLMPFLLKKLLLKE